MPLSSKASMADLATALELPLILAVADRLGAINHALLTIEAATARDLQIAALVLTEVELGAGQGLENREAIEQYGKVPVHELPHCTSDDQLAHFAAPILQGLQATCLMPL